jgi:hypothetical protein
MVTATRHFTPEEAHRTLPLVRKIVDDILNTSREIRLLTEDNDGINEYDPQVKKLVSELNGFMAELEEIGCFYKDWNFAIGLVDFPAIINGEEVFLCWKSDEDNIKFYHNVESGFSGRKPIPEKYFSNN